MSDQLLTVSPSPHIHQEATIPQVMRMVIWAMLPIHIVSVFVFGMGAVWVTLLAIVSCMAFEYLIAKYLLKQSGTLLDGSAVVTGMLLAFNLPSNLPWFMIVIGSAVAMGIGKMSFGGLGNNPFNPALVGRVFLLVSFPVQMTSWPTPNQGWTLDATTGATPLGLIKDGLRSGLSMSEILPDLPSNGAMLTGTHGGSLGEVSALAILLGFVMLISTRVISWHTPVSVIGTIFVLSGALWLWNPDQFVSPVFSVLSGGVLLGAVFMATDYVTSPTTYRGMIIFGIGIGLITILIRSFGAFPEGVSFAILIMNAFVPLINRYTRPVVFGTKKKSYE